MIWTDDEVEQAWVAWRAKSEPHVPEKALNDAMRRVMSLAVELVAARGVRERGSWSEDLALVVDGVTRDLRLAAAQRLSHDLVVQGATMATLEARVKALEQENAALQAKVEELKGRLERSIQAAQRSIDNEEILRGERDVARRDTSALRNKVEGLETRMGAVKTLHDELVDLLALEQRLHAADVEELSETKSALAALRAEVERLNGWREKCINDNNTWAARLIETESEVKRLKTVVSALDTRWRNEQDRAVAAEGEAERLHARVAERYNAVDEALRREDAARDEVERLTKMYQDAYHESERLVSEVERPKADVTRMEHAHRQQAQIALHEIERRKHAESRLAAVRERLSNVADVRRVAEAGWVGVAKWDETVRADVKGAGALPYLHHAAERVATWVLEGDATQEAKPHIVDCGPRTFGDVNPPQEAKARCPTHPEDGGACEPMQSEPWRCVYGEHALGGGEIRRYPCSPTCTHSDAANPGHPERIASLSVAFDQPMPETGVIASDESPERVRERNERLNEALFRADDDNTAAESDAYDRGAEAMRTAVENWAKDYFGSVPPTLKDALDGVAS